MKKLRIAFFGTPEFATHVLDELARAGMTPSLVVTAPDKPRGRKQELTPPEAKVWAHAHHIPTTQPATLMDANNLDVAVIYNTEWDLFIVAAYGLVIPKSMLDLPTHGTLNVHPSLLPKFRGASPIRSAILADERTTGVSIMMLDEELDHGPIVAQARIELEPDEWPPYGRVFDTLLARAGGELLAEVIPAWIEGSIEPEPQDHTQATYSKKITKDMGELDLSADPYQNLLKIRAFDGWPGTFFFTERHGVRTRVKIVTAELAPDGTLLITRVIPEGKKEMSYEDFLRGG